MKMISQAFLKIRHLFSPRIQKLSHENLDTPETHNPYIAARREWNFMYGDIIKAKHNWQQVALLLLMIQGVSLIGLITLALEKRFVPYVVRVDNLGNTNFTEFLTVKNTVSPLIINAMLRRYVVAARSVIADSVAEKQALDFVYGVTKGAAHTVLDHFYHTQNPFERVKEETLEVIVNAVLPKSAQTWQIDWTELHHDLKGDVTQQSHFEGLFTIAQHIPTNTEEININPLGLYVTALSWAEQQ
jgi:type IV secretion system protein VirB5